MSGIQEIKVLKDLLADGLQPGWVQASSLMGVIDGISTRFEEDMKNLEVSASYVFSTETDNDSHTTKTIDLFRSWIRDGKNPSLSALCYFAMEHLNIHEPCLRQMVLTCSFLGEIDNNLPYHSNLHFLKVTFQMIRMIAEHQEIYKDTSRVLTKTQKALMIATACIHDIGHDGKGNTVKGIYVPHRLEQNSFDLAKPVLEMIDGMSEGMLDTIHLMLICTDVSPLNDPANTLNQLKAAYRFHFLGENAKTEALNLDTEIKALESSPTLTLMCLMMHEADIATSAGLHYNITKYETSLLMQEIGTAAARPIQILNFLNNIQSMLLIKNRQMV